MENMLPLRRALFLDRDGTINVDSGYVCRKQDFIWIDGIFDLCLKAQQQGLMILVVTNQSGIARGYYSEEDFYNLTEFMVNGFQEHGIVISKVYHCPNLDGPDRKPAPGMFLKAAAEFNLDMPRSVAVGDKPRDVEAALAAGVGYNYLFSGDYCSLMRKMQIDGVWTV